MISPDMRYLWDEKGRELRAAVTRAHEAYTRAAEASKAILENPPTPPDAAYSEQVAAIAQAEHRALEEYTEALRAFNDHANQKKMSA